MRPVGAPNECRSHSANAVDEEDEEEAVPLGGVWMVGAVDEYEDENAWVMVKDEWAAKGFTAKQDVEVQNVGVRRQDGQERELGGTRPGRLVH